MVGYCLKFRGQTGPCSRGLEKHPSRHPQNGAAPTGPSERRAPTFAPRASRLRWRQALSLFAALRAAKLAPNALSCNGATGPSWPPEGTLGGVGGVRVGGTWSPRFLQEVYSFRVVVFWVFFLGVMGRPVKGASGGLGGWFPRSP